VPSRTVVKVGCSLGKKNVAERCCRGHSYDLESRPVTLVLEKICPKVYAKVLRLAANENGKTHLKAVTVIPFNLHEVS
jgi:hypothetical protein